MRNNGASAAGEETVDCSSEENSNIFQGVRFFLAGFDPAEENQYTTEIENNGGVNVRTYGATCTHVIVHRVRDDDPVCLAAKKDKKTLVTDLWVADSLDMGALVDPKKILYKPVRDLNGIPGCDSLCICLTGYQSQDRANIMRMVDMMGARFTKPLVAKDVTHLICYKFEGEKYKLAKQMNKKLVNHRWLEDCLKAWSIVPEENYQKSGWELELLETEAQDSEDEAVGELPSRIPEKTPDVAIATPLKHVDVGSNQKLAGAANSTRMTFTHGNDDGNAGKPLKSATPLQGKHSSRFQTPKNTCREEQKSEIATNVQSGSTPQSSKCDLGLLLTKRGEENKLSSVNSNVKTMHPITQLEGITSPSVNKVKDERNAVMSPQNNASAIVSTLARSLKRPSTQSSISKTLSTASWKTREKIDQMNDEMDGKENPIKDRLEDAAIESDIPKMMDTLSIPSRTEVNTSLPPSCSNKLDESASKLHHDRENATSPGPSKPDLLGSKFHDQSEDIFSHVATNDADMQNMSKEKALEGVSLENQVNLLVSEAENKSIPVGKKEEAPSGKGQRKRNLTMSKARPTSQAKTVVDKEEEPEQEEERERIELMQEKENLGNGEIKTNVKSKDSENIQSGSTEMITDADNKEFPLEDTPGTVDAKDENSVLKSKGRKKTVSKAKVTKGMAKEKNVTATASLVPDLGAKEETGIAISNKDPSSNLQDPSTNLSVSANLTIPQKADTQGNDGLGELATNNNERSEGTQNRKRGRSTSKQNASSMKKTKESCNNDPVATANSGDQTEKGIEKSVMSLLSGCNSSAAISDVLENDKSTNANQAEIAANELENESEQKVKAVKNNKLNTPEGKKSATKTKEEEEPAMKTKEEESEMKTGASKATKRPLLSKNKGSLSPSKTKGTIASVLTQKLLASNSKKGSTSKGVSNKNTKARSNSNKGSAKAPKRPRQVQKQLVTQNVKRDVKPTKESANKLFLLSGHRLQRKQYQNLIKDLGGKVLKDSHQWSYQATHLVIPEPLRRTEKFCAAAVAGRWILKTDYLVASKEAGRFLDEVDYEWHKSGLNEDGTISYETPRKWRLLREQTGCGALQGFRLIIYGECIAPSLDTLKRIVKAGGGQILATSPPYNKILASGVDFAIVSPGIPRDDLWVQEFLRCDVACILADYLVEYVCKPSYPLDKHVVYNTHGAVESFFKNRDLSKQLIVSRPPLASCPPAEAEDEICCSACGLAERADVMLLCGDDKGNGCGGAMHIDCCKPPLEKVPEEDWFCSKCQPSVEVSNSKPKRTKRS